MVVVIKGVSPVLVAAGGGRLWVDLLRTRVCLEINWYLMVILFRDRMVIRNIHCFLDQIGLHLEAPLVVTKLI